jgi:1-deoxy-D-xylulose-5-phosphate reductoisomerase
LQPATLNAANEVAVQAFLDRQLNFIDIAAVIETVVKKSTGGNIGGLDDVLAADSEARQLAREQVSTSQGGGRMAYGGVVRDAHA